MIFFIMGKSSSGKDTVFGKLMEDESLHLRKLVGYTTRPKREQEQDGVEYYFVSEDEMNALELAGKVIEKRAYHTVYGTWYYFTADDGQIDWKENRQYLYIGTLESYLKLKEYFGAEQVIPIYIRVEDGVRLRRAMEREEKQRIPKYAEMCRRYLADEEDFKTENIEKAGITRCYDNNGSIDDTLQMIVDDIKKENTKKETVCGKNKGCR